MADALLDRLCDRLVINDTYGGIVAEGYDAWLPVEDVWPDEPVYRRLLAGVDGPILELGCGTGRPMLRWLADGLDVEGLDASDDMVGILRRHAADRGLDPVVHLGDMGALDLGRRYGAIVSLAGTFCLVGDDDRARRALRSYREHLVAGGVLALSLFVPVDAFAEELRWRVRRTGTTPGGDTIMVSEALRCDREARRQVALNRIERFTADGLLTETRLRRYELHWWERATFAGLLAEAGFTGIESVGDEVGWVAVGRAPVP